MRALSHRKVLILLLPALATAFVGCGKWRTDWALNPAKKKLTNIVEYQGEQYKENDVKQLRDMIDQAESAKNQENFAVSIPKAKEARQKSIDLLREVRQMHSAAMKQQAHDDMDVIRANDGAKLNPTLYSEIETLLQEIDNKYQDSKHDEVILMAQELHSKTKELLEPLRQKAEAGVKDVEAAYQKMELEQAPQRAERFYKEVGRLLDEIKQLIDPQRKYTLALDQIDLALRTAAEGITEARRLRSLEKINNIEQMLSTARSLGAGTKYAINLYEQCSERYLAFVESHYNNQDYITVLDNIGTLEELVKELILRTKEEAAAEARDNLDKALVELINGQAKEYGELRSNVEEIEGLLKQARDKYDAGQEKERLPGQQKFQAEKDYTDSKSISETGLEKAKNVKQRFDRLATDFISTAQNQVDETRQTFNRAKQEGFFIPKAEGKVLEPDLPFERSKKALMEEIEASLSSSQSELKRAESLRKDEKYHEAIVISKRARFAALESKADVVHVAAHNALVEIADRARHFQQDGAGQYATAQIEKAQNEVQKVRDIIREGQRLEDGSGKVADVIDKYENALDMAADARASIETAVSRLHQVANDLLEKAKGEFQQLQRERDAQRKKPTEAERIDSLIERSSENLGVSPPTPLESNEIKYKSTIEMTKEAIERTEELRRTIAREGANMAIAKAAADVERAEVAGADTYAAPLMSDARSKLDESRKLLGVESYELAEQTAEHASEMATQAFYQRVNAADDSIVSARFYQGWNYRQEELAEAIILNKRAKQALAEGRYDEAHLLSMQSKRLAERVTRASREKDFVMRVRRMKRLLKAASGSGAGFYRPAEVKRLIAELYDLDENFAIARYDEFDQRLAALEGEIENTLNTTPEAIEEAIAKQVNYLASLERLGADRLAPYELGLARRAYEQAEIEYERESFGVSYQYFLKGLSLANLIADRVLVESYRDEADQLLAELADLFYAFRTFLTQDPSVLKFLAKGFHGQGQVIAFTGTMPGAVYYYEDGKQRILTHEARVDTVEFADRIADIYNRAMAVEVPAPYDEYHRKLMGVIRHARLAGENFRLFPVLNRYTEERRVKIIDDAYEHYEQSLEGLQRLRDQLIAPELRRRPNTYNEVIENQLPIR